MRVQAGEQFQAWLQRIEQEGGRRLARVRALLVALRNLPSKPGQESATFKRVRQARRHELWRVSHPFDPDVAVRIICWFPDEQTVVVAVIGGDKKTLGNLWYDSATTRAESIVDQWLRAKKGGAS